MWFRTHRAPPSLRPAHIPHSCLDPAIAIKPVFERFSTVVITSGTLSPLDMYPKMLQFTPVVQETYAMSLTRNSFLPLVSNPVHAPPSRVCVCARAR